MQKDRCLSIQMITDMVNSIQVTVRLLHDELNRTSLNKVGPQKSSLKNKKTISFKCVLISWETYHLDLLIKIITCDETWDFPVWLWNQTPIDALKDSQIAKNEKSSSEQEKYPDLTPCDFYLFLKVKRALKEMHF